MVYVIDSIISVLWFLLVVCYISILVSSIVVIVVCC